jgi:hypothetical protein
MAVNVTVVNADGSVSAAVPFTLQFPAVALQSWTTVESVAAEVPSFLRGGQIGDEHIQKWIESTAQAIAAAMLRRDLPLDPAQWQPSSGAGQPTPQGLLEMINRHGAAAQLAAAIAANFESGDWALRKNLEARYQSELADLNNGDYDKLFLPSAATVEPGPQFGAGDMTNREGWPERAFTKEQRF